MQLICISSPTSYPKPPYLFKTLQVRYLVRLLLDFPSNTLGVPLATTLSCSSHVTPVAKLLTLRTNEMAGCHSCGFSMVASSPPCSRSSGTYFPAAPSSSSSCSPRVLTPPSPTQQQHNMPPSPIQQQLRILIIMGSCTWTDGFLRCSCNSGSSLTSDPDVNQASCVCGHPMLLHQNACWSFTPFMN